MIDLLPVDGFVAVKSKAHVHVLRAAAREHEDGTPARFVKAREDADRIARAQSRGSFGGVAADEHAPIRKLTATCLQGERYISKIQISICLEASGEFVSHAFERVFTSCRQQQQLPWS